jgi:hypothetical protein
MSERLIPTTEYDLAIRYFQLHEIELAKSNPAEVIQSAIFSQRGFGCREWGYITKKSNVVMTKGLEHEVIMIVPISKLVAAIADRQPSLF